MKKNMLCSAILAHIVLVFGISIMARGAHVSDLIGWGQILPPPPIPPEACWGSSDTMTYDANRNIIVLFGPACTQTWEYDGTSWTQRFPAHNPPASTLRYGMMVYDSYLGTSVLLACPDDCETWEYDGNDWSRTYTNHTPGNTYGMVYDSGRNVVVSLGGNGGWAETWEYDGDDWIQRYPVDYPKFKSQPAMAYDNQRGVTVLFGGGWITELWNLHETWEYDGINWALLDPTHHPEERSGAAMVYNSVDGTMIMFGGDITDDYGWHRGLTDQTWIWNGIDWSSDIPAGSPSPRVWHAMTYDSHRQRTVLFGGVETGNVYLTDTWEYPVNLSATPSPTLTLTPTLVFTRTPRPTATETPTITLTPTSTSPSTMTATPTGTSTATPAGQTDKIHLPMVVK